MMLCWDSMFWGHFQSQFGRLRRLLWLLLADNNFEGQAIAWGGATRKGPPFRRDRSFKEGVGSGSELSLIALFGGIRRILMYLPFLLLESQEQNRR
jgi:hypothetical protein